MSRAVQCPSCGAQHEVSNPGITGLSCSYCKTFFYWDAQAVHDSGVKATLDPPSSRLQVGGTASVNKQDLTVLGRVRYSYGGGVWDEWFLEDAGQNIIWLTEDEKEFSLEKPLPPDPNLPPFDTLQLGVLVTLHKRSFAVEELGKAACLGVEGQVPFVVIPGEVYPFADLASTDGSLSVGLEYDAGDQPHLFQGQFIARDAVQVDGEPAWPESVAAGIGVRCAGCGSPIEGQFPPDTEMLVCPSCGSGLELGATQTKVICKNTQEVRFQIEIGAKASFDKVDYEVVGRLRYQERDEGVTYISDEYLLYNDRAGYLWLEENDTHHWVLARRSHVQPGVDLFGFMSPRDKVRIGKTKYEFVESGRSSLIYVDGALPWVAKVGETFRYADLVSPPRTYSVEKSTTGDSQELEIFEGRYVPIGELKEAFGRDFDKPYGVAPSQPFERSASQKAMLGFGLLFVAINVVLLFGALGAKGRLLVNTQIDAQQYRGEWLSEPFEIKGKPAVLKLGGRASVNNSWVALSMGLVNANDEVALETETEASYYHGVEGGERWSEGSRSFGRYLRVDTPGSYRLLVFGTAGRGNAADAMGGPTLKLYLREGARPTRLFWIMIILSALYPAKEIMRKRSHEARRIPVESDDDD